MKRRGLIAFIWFWGVWSLGSTLEFLGILPTLPFLLLGAAIAAFIMGVRPRVSAAPGPTEPAHHAR
jgi:hypothetical protein